MENRSNPWMPVVVLIVGLALAYAIFAGFARLAVTFDRKDFRSSFNQETEPRVITLSGDRFAVVERTTVSVYKVDAGSKVIRLSDVNTNYQDLEPRKRWQNPVQRSPQYSTP